jgi:protein-S-isoprenylcysteine O-methyltransferase Ste14
VHTSRDQDSIYTDKSPSIAAKATLVVTHLVVLGAVIWLLLGPGLYFAENLFRQQERLAPSLMRYSLVTAGAIYFGRTSVTLVVFMKRRMRWSEGAFIAIWIAMFSFMFAYFGGRNEGPVGFTVGVGCLLYLSGSALNTVSELQRHIWKSRIENSGHLYTGGLFRYSRHINYFGDEILFIGWATLTGCEGLMLVPLVLAAGFVFANIPLLDKYLEDRYKDEYRTYARSVKQGRMTE